MEKKRLVTIATTAAIALTLAGCGAKQAANSTGSSSETSLLAKKSATKISANNLSPQKTVSLVTVYAGNKFGGAWAKTAKAAKKNGLVTDLESTNGYKLSGKNQGVAYHVHANNQSWFTRSMATKFPSIKTRRKVHPRSWQPSVATRWSTLLTTTAKAS